MNVLCFCISDRYSISRFCHSADVKNESVWVALAEINDELEEVLNIKYLLILHLTSYIRHQPS